MLTRRQSIGAASAALMLPGFDQAKANDSLFLLDAVLAEPNIVDAAISPDGGRIAVLRVIREGKQRKAVVTFSNADQVNAEPQVALLGDCEVERVSWVNDQRLLVWVLLDKDASGKTVGIVWKGDTLVEYTRRVIALDRDGGNLAVLFANQSTAMSRRRNLGSVVDLKSDSPDCILMQAWNDLHRVQALYKVNIHSGDATLLELGANDTDGWITQNGAAVLRLDSNGSTVSVFARPPGGKEWSFFKKFRRDQYEKLAGMRFLGPSETPGVLYASVDGSGGEDRATIRTFDVRYLQTGPVLDEHPEYDVTGCVVDSNGALVATSWWEDRLAYRFKDPDLSKHYQAICGYFRSNANVKLTDFSSDFSRFIFWVSGPQHPGSFWLYDRKATKLQPIAVDRPDLPPSKLGLMEIIKIVSRDGLKLTAYLTVPAGAETTPTPLVVFPHGGPEARDYFAFDELVQSFAVQGWRVLQVNFRGSSGQGRRFAEAGKLHWGDLMQNDIEDALAAVLQRGSIDEKKIAICGISYGGYAALMGAVKTPTRYKAVVSIAGDADLFESLNITRRIEGSDSLAFAYWKGQIGDPDRNRDLMIAASPALQAKSIQAPVLLQHGALDGIVGVEQSRTMLRALRSAGRKVDYFEYPTEGHPKWRTENHRLMTRRSIDHIAKAFA